MSSDLDNRKSQVHKCSLVVTAQSEAPDDATGLHSSGAKRKNHLFLHHVAPSVCETTFTAERWATVCVEGLEPSHDRRTSSRGRFVNVLKSERAAFVFASTSRPLPPLREDYGALK